MENQNSENQLRRTYAIGPGHNHPAQQNNQPLQRQASAVTTNESNSQISDITFPSQRSEESEVPTVIDNNSVGSPTTNEESQASSNDNPNSIVTALSAQSQQSDSSRSV